MVVLFFWLDGVGDEGVVVLLDAFEELAEDRS